VQLKENRKAAPYGMYPVPTIVSPHFVHAVLNNSNSSVSDSIIINTDNIEQSPIFLGA
jgi:hypothetical protein